MILCAWVKDTILMDPLLKRDRALEHCVRTSILTSWGAEEDDFPLSMTSPASFSLPAAADGRQPCLWVVRWLGVPCGLCGCLYGSGWE